MGLLDIFKTNIDNIELAEELFNTLSVGGSTSPKYERAIKKIENEYKDETGYPDRQKILLKVIELAGEPITPKQRYLLAIAYAWSRANYREKAIYYLELYLNNEICDEICKRYSSDGNYEEGKKKHLIEMYNFLAKAYISEYDFNKGLEISEKMIEIYPQNPMGYFTKTEALTKQNELNKCQEWLIEVKKSKYYKIYKYKDALGREFKDDWFYTSINRLLTETEEKIKKGYVYRPRKKKSE